MPLIKEQLCKSVVDFFFPAKCVGCGKTGSFLCASCSARLPWVMPPFCGKCGKPETSGEFCPSCWGGHTKIDGIRSPFRFEGIIRTAVHELKYHNLKALAGHMAELIARYLDKNQVPGELLLPVPLHLKRLRQRGYNQSYLVAAELGRLINLPVMKSGLMRVKDNIPQTRTSTVEERRRNVYNAFACCDTVVNQKKIILVDDVCTSGATLEACASALKKSGASSVWGLTIAREI